MKGFVQDFVGQNGKSYDEPFEVWVEKNKLEKVRECKLSKA